MLRLVSKSILYLAGTSAGAAIIPEHMIAGGSKGALPTQQGVTFAPGLGLLNKVIIDQHFSNRYLSIGLRAFINGRSRKRRFIDLARH